MMSSKANVISSDDDDDDGRLGEKWRKWSENCQKIDVTW